MTGKQLKNSILQWAIQGKLVPQDPNDEPASVLLEKIRQEKERLIKEKKIKRDKNASIIYRGEDNSYYEKVFATGEVKCIDDEIPFEIPTNWVWTRLGEICGYLHRGKSPQYGEQQLLPIIAQKCNQWDRIYTDRCLFSSKDSIEKYKEEQYVKKGDIIINSTGGGTVGRTGYVDDYVFNSFNKFVVDSHVTLVRAMMPIEPKYIYYFLVSPFIQFGLEDRCSGSTNQIELGTNTIYNYLTPIPPVEEQKRLIERIEEVYPLLDNYSKHQTALNKLNEEISNNLKKSILQEAIQGRLVPQMQEEGSADQLLKQIQLEKQKLFKEGKLKKAALTDSTIYRGDDNKYYEQIGSEIKDITDELPFEIPDTWAWSRLGSLCDIKNGFTPLRTNNDFWNNGTINWFTVDDIRKQGEIIYDTDQHITDKAATNDRIVRAGSTLLCCTASVGVVALTKIPLTTNQQFNALTVKDINKNICIDEFIYWYAKSLKSTLIEIAGKTTFSFVSVKKVSNILIPLPPKKEQQRIVAQIEKLFEQLR